jgi:Skp family chaperone for outer membrane proteins
LRSDFLTVTEQLDSKLQAATENITAKIQQENEKLTQNLHNEVKKLSSDICTLRSDTEHRFQEVIRTIGGISDALNERIG